MKESRTLTDDDVAAIVVALRKEIMQDFYRDLGQGVWGWAKRVIFTTILMVAAYGVAKGLK